MDGIGHISVIGEDEEPLGIEIEPTHRENPLVLFRDEGTDAGTALGVGHGGNDEFRFIERQIPCAARPHGPPVDAYAVYLRVESVP
ncbi:MAG: hypothetical protein BWY77_01985 [bacterium ADurb.Bin431]|nr:MAG: hypothetical protein BWY77_01985 [bacterium ADurb.Bin431]